MILLHCEDWPDRKASIERRVGLNLYNHCAAQAVQSLALSPHSMNGTGLIPRLGALLCGACMLSLCLCGFGQGYSGFLQQSKVMHIRLITNWQLYMLCSDHRCVDGCLCLFGLPCRGLLSCPGCNPDLWPQGSWGTVQ